MITLDEAFSKFKSRLELTDSEQQDASSRQIRVREILREAFHSETDFLSGSYGRRTKTKPLKDVDIFFVLSEEEDHYLDEPSRNVLEAFRKTLAKEYGAQYVSTGRRSVQISFGLKEEEAEGKVMSIDVVPAFSERKAYKIPDPLTAAGWTKTDPEIHAEEATAANKAFDGQWVPMVKMLKKWNNVHDKPIKPSFLVEVMALDLLCPPFSGGYVYELKGFFATAAARVFDEWPDPAGLGPPVSDQMTDALCQAAAQKLREAERNVSTAIQLAKQGRNGDALRIWREKIFGDMFPLS